MNQVVVLETEGKNDSVGYAKVVIFDTPKDALAYCKENNTGRQKYWKRAEVVRQGVPIELKRAEDWDLYLY